MMSAPSATPAPNTVRSDRSKFQPIASDNREAFVWKSSRQASKNSEFRHGIRVNARGYAGSGGGSAWFVPWYEFCALTGLQLRCMCGCYRYSSEGAAPAPASYSFPSPSGVSREASPEFGSLRGLLPLSAPIQGYQGEPNERNCTKQHFRSNTLMEEASYGESHGRSRGRRWSSEVQFNQAEPSPAARLESSRRPSGVRSFLSRAGGCHRSGFRQVCLRQRREHRGRCPQRDGPWDVRGQGRQGQGQSPRDLEQPQRQEIARHHRRG